ncbi:M48 family metallopeptidase [Paenibacillus allorhizosphaerae]|uniref:Protease HtpX n=1 Tax=Paenibacillus allorhizosphaerae TaxID=2849866 RepID=A0ABM8VJC1_9BACL|nr:M48 family metallopeptidase [Paenibacillus allorhizosphaerae]CAG7645142.1 Protease HtpX [Paenibacillus allorhizosphaerae]
MSDAQRKLLRIFFMVFAIYAILMALYVCLFPTGGVPTVYRGTAADPATYLSEAQLQQSQTLSAARNWIFFISYPWEWAVYLVLLLAGFAGRWQERLERTVRPVSLRFPLYVLWINLIVFLVFLPLRITSYSLSRSYGLSTQTVWSWLRDKAVGFGVNYAVMLLVAAVAFWFIRRGGRWWVKLWLLSVPFTLFMIYIQPVVIDPLYNEFTRLSDPKLERHILDLAAKADIPADRVYEVDMSQKTNELNAYVTGIGSSLRIVLWDTTLRSLMEPEILLIMAHEMGHYVMHHLEWSAVGAVVSSFFLIWIGSWLYRWVQQRWGRSLGIPQAGSMAGFPLVLLILSVLTFVSLPVANTVSRQAEHAADLFAFELIGSSDNAVTMYQKLAASSLSDVNPPLLVKLFRSTHPSIMERIIDAQTYRPAGK